MSGAVKADDNEFAFTFPDRTSIPKGKVCNMYVYIKSDVANTRHLRMLAYLYRP